MSSFWREAGLCLGRVKCLWGRRALRRRLFQLFVSPSNGGWLPEHGMGQWKTTKQSGAPLFSSSSFHLYVRRGAICQSHLLSWLTWPLVHARTHARPHHSVQVHAVIDSEWHPLIWTTAPPPRQLRPFLRPSHAQKHQSQRSLRSACVAGTFQLEHRMKNDKESAPVILLWPHWATEAEQKPREGDRPCDGETGWSPTLEMSDLWPFWHRSQNVNAPVTLPESHLWADPACVCMYRWMSFLLNYALGI